MRLQCSIHRIGVVVSVHWSAIVSPYNQVFLTQVKFLFIFTVSKNIAVVPLVTNNYSYRLIYFFSFYRLFWTQSYQEWIFIIIANDAGTQQRPDPVISASILSPPMFLFPPRHVLWCVCVPLLDVASDIGPIFCRLPLPLGDARLVFFYCHGKLRN